MDPTSSESSIKYSIKEYFLTFVQNATTGVSTPVSFDAFEEPKANSIKKWILVLINVLGIKKSKLSQIILTIYFNTREDAEGYESSVLRDTIYSLLSGSHDSITTPVGMIPLYDIETKARSGSMTLILDDISQGEDFTAADGTRCKIMTIPIKMASK